MGWIALVCVVVLIIWYLAGIGHRKRHTAGRIDALKVDAVLRKRCCNSHVFHDVTLKTDGWSSKIDHIVIGPSGILCVDSKNLNGKLWGKINEREWLHTNGEGMTHAISNLLMQNDTHLRHLAKVLGLKTEDIDAIVVNIGNAKLRGDIKPHWFSSHLGGRSIIATDLKWVSSWTRRKGRWDRSDIDNMVVRLKQVRI